MIGGRDVHDGVVLLQWVHEMSWKEQSALLAAFRGPDVPADPCIKIVVKWIRSLCQNDADPDTTFMKVDLSELPTYVEFAEAMMYMTMHFTDHIMTGLALIAKYSPYPIIRAKAKYFVKAVWLDCLHVPSRIAMALPMEND